jgi:acyl transferase domain-containing protein/acyl carrier protein/predicted O-methyltransferase YrrM
MEPIAIVGIGCRFPGASGPEAFWQLLMDRRDAIVEVPPTRWNRDALYHDDPTAAPGTIRNRLGGFLDGIEQFDATFFGISPREATAMDPQQRLLLEAGWEAMEDAGLIVDRLRGTKVGVFVGIAAYDYAEIQHGYENRHLIGPHTNTGLALSIAANRISYIFDFRGPSVAVDTACSSSLVAVHLACRSLQARESEIVLVGGVNAILKPEPTIGFSRASMLSPDGRCKTFDARANGYTRGEGAGVVVLKRLSDAVAAGDHIYAVVRGSAVNQDGQTKGMSVPSQEAQEAALCEAFGVAGIDPSQAQYIEAHGTGTPVGDPIEARALGTVLGRGRPDGDYCLVGSVKTNIGHLEAAAGIAGLIKAALSIERRTIPASLNFERPNPEIPFDALKLRVVTETAPWPENGHPARAGINSFGFGGTNAHVVLEEAPSRAEPAAATAPVRDDDAADRRTGAVILPVSARTPDALRGVASAYADALEQHAGARSEAHLRAACYWASVRRSHHGYRAAVVGRSATELAASLRAMASGGTPHVGEANKARSSAQLAFVYSGMGSQWWAMGRQLMDAEPVFRRALERCDALFRQRSGWSLLPELLADEDASRMGRTDVSQPCLFILQVGLTELWRSWGVVPGAIVGHSAGEVAACYAAGVLTIEEATDVIYHRSRLQQTAAGRGKMAAVGMSEEEALRRIAPYGDRVSVAAANGPASVTLSGDGDVVDEIVSALEREGIFARHLRVDVPYHSRHMDGLDDELFEVLAGLRPALPAIPLYSTVTGRLVEDRAYDAPYWWRNIRDAVRFADAIGNIAAAGSDTFLEIGPHPVLGSAVSECLTALGAPGAVLPSLRRKTDEPLTMLRSLGDLFGRGFEIDWKGLHPPQSAPFVRLPSYAWQRQPYWHESARSKSLRLTPDVHPLLGRRRPGPRAEWSNLIDARVLALLGDHRFEGAVLYPGAGYVEMALAAAEAETGTASAIVEDVVFERALVLPEAEPVETSVAYDAETGEVTVHAGGADGATWERHARCTVRPLREPAAKADIASLRAACGHEVFGPYEIFARAGLQYGPAFQGIEQVWQGPGAAFAAIRPIQGAADAGRYALHPSLLDACFQVLISALIQPDGSLRTYLPIAIDRLVRYAPADAETTLWAHARVERLTDTHVVGDIRLFDDSGNVLAAILGFTGQALGAKSGTAQALAESLYAFRWRPDASAGAGAVTADGLLRPDDVAQRVRGLIPDIVDSPERAAYYREVEPALDRACALIAARAFARLGLPLAAGDRIDADRLPADVGAAGPAMSRLVRRMMTMLEANGFARRTGSGWRIDRPIDAAGDVAGLIEPLLRRFPLYAPELDLLRRCGERLPEVIRGEFEPLQLIFPEGSLSVAERIYRESRSFGIYNAIAREAVRAIADALPENATLRILEIGAGVGSLTAEVLGVLPEDRTQYVYTDVSGTFTQKAAQQFARYRFLEYRTLDLESPPETQGFEPGGFHLVLASDVLHATRDLRRSLGYVRELLAPGGLLVASELTKPPFWFDLVFGLLPGWWLFDDDDVRPEHACISGAAWRRLAAETGFPEIELLADASGEAGETVHSVLVARSADTARATALHASKAAEPAETGAWLLLRDTGGVGARLGEALSAMGQRVIVADRADAFTYVDATRFAVAPTDMYALVETAFAKNADLRGIVYLWGLDHSLDAASTTEHVLAAANDICGSALDLMKALAARQDVAEPSPRLILVTAGAEHVLATDATSPVQASLWGLGRVFLNEHPEIPCSIVDLSRSPDDAEIAMFAQECVSARADAGRESEIAQRGGSRFVHRLDAASLDALAQGYERPARPDEAFRLDYAKTGALENLLVRASARVAPGPGEVEIRVANGGLNFRDVMKVLGIYPTEDGLPQPLGDECAGTVVAVGDGVDGFAVGDRVAAIASGFASYVTVDKQLVARLPDAVSFADGATIPITFLTAHYALRRLAHLHAGERVLIHAAAGGVGQAALQLARIDGATVFATAGTVEKRAFLRSLGVEHVFDSRSLDFADRILEITNGEGVDVVLNSLSGRAIPKSLALLRPYGRFLEIGKTDIYRDSKLGLRPFRKNLSYFAIDLDAVFKERQALAEELLHSVMAEVSRGDIEPLRNRIFPVSQAESAFRYMAQAKHIGKVVLSMEDPRVKVAPRRYDVFPLRGDALYLITGGLGGLGRTLAAWMVDHGARNIVLMGRSGAATPDAQQDVEMLRARGAAVEIVRCDVADEAALQEHLAALRRKGLPLRGIVHGAMVLDDGLIPQLDRRRLERVLAPKIGGAWALHRHTLDDPLDFFVMFSSFASTVGNIGQANYAAANAFLDSLAHRRRVEGRPALTINWGAISAQGYVAEHAEIEQHFRRQGLRSFPAEHAFSVLEALLRRDAVQVGVVDIDWPTWGRFAPEIANSPRFRHLVENERGGAGGGADGDGADLILDRLKAASAHERKAILLRSIQEQLAAVLGLAADNVDPHQAPSALGLDSLMAVEFSCLIEDRLGFKPSTIELIQAQSLSSLADRLVEKIAA